jgi:hypothetical protein
VKKLGKGGIMRIIPGFPRLFGKIFKRVYSREGVKKRIFLKRTFPTVGFSLYFIMIKGNNGKGSLLFFYDLPSVDIGFGFFL